MPLSAQRFHRCVAHYPCFTLLHENDFEQARERWQQATAARRELQTQLAGAQAALALKENPASDGEQRSPVVEAKAEAYLNGHRADPDRLRREIRELQDRVIDGADRQMAESAAWQQALEAEQHRLAELCRPKHSAAVRQIASAVEMLSAAVQTERECSCRARGCRRTGTRCPTPASSSARLAEYREPVVAVEQAPVADRAAVMPPLYEDTGPPLLLCGYASVFDAAYSQRRPARACSCWRIPVPRQRPLDFDHQGRCLASTYGWLAEALAGRAMAWRSRPPCARIGPRSASCGRCVAGRSGLPRS